MHPSLVALAACLESSPAPQPRWAEVPTVGPTIRGWVWEEPTRHRVLTCTLDELVYVDTWRGVAAGIEQRIRTDLELIVALGSVDAATSEIMREAWLWRHRARSAINLARIDAARAEAQRQYESFDAAVRLSEMALAEECGRRG